MAEPLWVKVCGLTRAGDVEAAIAAGADAVGLIMVERSPRRLEPAIATELAAVADGRAEVVVLLEGDPDAAIETARRIGADTVQAYGPQAVELAAAAIGAGLKALLPVAVRPASEIDLSGVPKGARALLDTSVGGASGGTGMAFDWRRAAEHPSVVIAGGLDADNVARAIATAHPWGVDASSGLEQSVGVKDHGKVTAFVAAARAADQ